MDRLVGLYEEHQSIRKVGEILGWSREKVRYRLKDLGLLNRSVRHSFLDNFFSFNTPESFYWAGFIAADGCMFKERKKYAVLRIGLANKDTDHLVKFSRAINFTGPLYKNKATEIRIRSDQICEDLRKFNITERKSLVLNFPEWLKDHSLVNHFMRGYFDGDGSFYIPNQNVKTPQLYLSVRGTFNFLLSFKEVLEEKCGLEINPKKPRPNSGIYVLDYGGNKKVKNIAKFLYQNSSNNTRMNRKHIFLTAQPKRHANPGGKK